MKVFVLNGSPRVESNTEMLINQVLEGIPHTTRYLRDYTIVPIEDKRHEPDGFAVMPQDDYRQLIKEMLDHDIVIYATPVYWYGMSGIMKNFIDRWSESLRDPEIDFKARMSQIQSYVVTVGGDSPYQKALPLIQQFHHIVDFVGSPLKGYLIGEGNRPGDVLQDTRALAGAAALNQQIRSKV